MFGWLSAEAALASFSNRLRRAGSFATSAMQHLQRDVSREPGVPREVDLPHAARAEGERIS